MNHSFNADKFKVESKKDLYTTLYVKMYTDYHGESIYDQFTPFGYCKDIENLNDYINMLNVDEIMNYADEMGGTILHNMVVTDRPIEFFDVIVEKIGYENFAHLLNISNRNGDYPLNLVQSLDLFMYLLKFSELTADMVRKISIKGPEKVIEYITECVNYVTESELINESETDENV